MVALLQFLFWLFAAFAVCHYTFNTIFDNTVAVVAGSAVFAILYAVLVHWLGV